MSLSSATGALNVTTATAGNTVVVSGLGFQPSVVLFCWSGRTATGSSTGQNKQSGFGAGTSSTNRFAVDSLSVDNSASAFAKSGQSASACIIELDTSTGAISGSMDVQSLDSDGFTLVIDVAFTTDLFVQYLALGGSSLTNVTTGAFTPSGTAPTTQAISSVGFQPTAVLFFGANIQSASDVGATADSNVWIGSADGTNAFVSCGASNDGNPNMLTARYTRSGECIADFVAAITSMGNRASFTSLDANGFTISWIERSRTSRVFYVALAGVNVSAGSLTFAVDGSNGSVSGLGFTPSALMLVSQGAAFDAADTPATDDRMSVGFATSATSRQATSWLDLSGQANATCVVAHQNVEIYQRFATNSAVATGFADIASFDSDGFTIASRETQASTQAWYVALGPAAVVTPTGGPFPHFIPRTMSGGFIQMSGGVN